MPIKKKKQPLFFTNSMGQDVWIMEEGKTYVSSPAGAPEGASVKRGPKGGYYYEEPAGKKDIDVGKRIKQLKTARDIGTITSDEYDKAFDKLDKATKQPQHRVGEPVRIAPDLTTDPAGKQGSWGNITKINDETGDVHVKFRDGTTGIYESDALMGKDEE